MHQSFVVQNNYENILTTKISRSTIYNDTHCDCVHTSRLSLHHDAWVDHNIHMAIEEGCTLSLLSVMVNLMLE